jgi:hypothetical protein
MLANLVPAPGARHLCDPRIGMLANLVPAPRCQAPLRSQNRNAGKSSPRTRCQAPLRSRIGMLANLVHSPGASHLCDPRIGMLANLVPAPRCQAPGDALEIFRSFPGPVTRRVTRAEQTSTVADHPKPPGSQPLGLAAACNNLHTHKIE